MTGALVAIEADAGWVGFKFCAGLLAFPQASGLLYIRPDMTLLLAATIDAAANLEDLDGSWRLVRLKTKDILVAASTGMAILLHH